MPVKETDRPLPVLRQQCIDQLILNYGHGKLSLDAFERRLDDAIEATSHEQLAALTEDLDAQLDVAYRERKQREFAPLADEETAEDTEHMIHVFSGTNRRGPWVVAKEISMVNVFGGCDLDFGNARFSSRRTHIKVVCIFGGATLHVPEGVGVVSKVVGIFGGVDNQVGQTDLPDAPTIVLEGVAIFGGVHVRLKVSVKERWLQFANSIREMFGAN
jgi:hypothetical protein